MPFTVKKAKAISTDSLDSLGNSVGDLAQWAEDEFSAVASAMQGTEPDTIWNNAPPKPRRGTYAYADGTNWNPGYGEGPYTFNGSLWVPSRGDLLWNTSLSMTAAQRAQALGNLGASAKWNRFVNGGLQISQENGATALTANGAYPVDGWTVGWVTGTYTHQQIVTPTPGGSPYRIKITVTSGPGSVGASDYLFVAQFIEGYRIADLRSGSSAAKTVTIRFGVNMPAAGTYSVSIRNTPTYNRSYVTTFTIAAGEVGQDVIKSVTIPLDQSGSWNTDANAGIIVGLCFYSGSTYTTAPNVWTAGNFINATGAGFNAANGNHYDFFEPRMDEGTAAQPFQMPDYVSELATCMRYFQIIDGGIWSMNAAGVTSYYFATPFKVEMRTNPTSVTQITAPTLVTCTAFAPNLSNTTSRTARFDMTAGGAGVNYAQGGQWKFITRP